MHGTHLSCVVVGQHNLGTSHHMLAYWVVTDHAIPATIVSLQVEVLMSCHSTHGILLSRVGLVCVP